MKFQAELEIDKNRGVLYVHSTDPGLGGVTLLRICGLPTRIPNPKFTPLDITVRRQRFDLFGLGETDIQTVHLNWRDTSKTLNALRKTV